MPEEHLVSWVGGEYKSNDLQYSWSGVLGFTPDGYPYVGELPDRPGQFVVAGFNGHGMARGFLTVNALCQLMYHEPMHHEPMQSPLPDVYLDIATWLRRTDHVWNETLQRVRKDRNN